MSARKIEGILFREVNEAVAVSGEAHERGPRGFAEGEAEFHGRIGGDDRFMDILHGLDEMGLTEDEIHLGGLVDGH